MSNKLNIFSPVKNSVYKIKNSEPQPAIYI